MGALNKLVPDRLTEELLATARDKQMDSSAGAGTDRSGQSVGHRPGSVNWCRCWMIPRQLLLFHNPTGEEWRICDRAVKTVVYGWEPERPCAFIPPEQRAANLNRVREWARQAP